MIAYVSATQATNGITTDYLLERIQGWFGAHIQSAANFKPLTLSLNYERVVVHVFGEPAQQLCIKTNATQEVRVYNICVPRRDRLQQGELPLYVVGPDERSVMMLADFLGQSFVPDVKFGQLIDKLATVRQEMEITNITVKQEVDNLLEFRDFFVKSDSPISVTQFIQDYPKVVDKYREWEFVRLVGNLRRSDIALQDTGVLVVDAGVVGGDERANIEAVLGPVRSIVDQGLWVPQP